MRILQIAPQIPYPLDDGGRIGIYGITNYLHQRGNKIDFAVYRKHCDYNSSFNALKNICTPHILNVQTDNNIPKALINLLSPIPYNIAKFIRKEMQEFLVWFLKNYEVDIVHVDHAHMGWTIDIIKNIKDVPVVLREHNVEMRIMKRFAEHDSNPFLRTYALLQYKKFLKYEPMICGKFDNCIMITREDENEILHYNPKIKTSVIPAGIDPELLKFTSKETIPFSLFHIGSLKWLPNLDGLNWFLDEVFPKVINKIPNVKLFIYGKGSENLRINSLLKNNIIVRGYVEDIFSEISDKQVAIVPLRVGGGMRIKIIELMALGKSIISTTIGKEGIDVIDNEHILIADNKEDFVNKISNVFYDKVNAGKLIKSAREFVRDNYTWENVALQFENKYKELIK
jgi:glycosyltransferase involved in cell wall biosynthesis